MIIATRILKLRDPKGDTEIPVRIFLPELRESYGWECRYEIDWPDEREARAMYGYDSAQAILLTFQFIGCQIYTSEEHKSGNLFAGEPGRDYGFPVPHIIRDLLIGDDAKFF